MSGLAVSPGPNRTGRRCEQPGNRPEREETSMTSRSRTTLGRGLGVLVAGAVVVTSLTIATAAAVAPPPPTPAPQATRPDPNAASTAAIGAFGSGLSPKAATGPRSQFPIFVLDQGRFTRFDPPGPAEQQRNADNPVRINNRGQISGVYLQGDAQQGSGPPLPRFRGFLRDPRGRTTRIDVPGAAGTIPFDLNDRGQLVGISSTTTRTPPTPATRAGSCATPAAATPPSRCPARPRPDARDQQPRPGGRRVHRHRRWLPRVPVGQGRSSPWTVGRPMPCCAARP